MAALLLDTTVLIDALRGRPAASRLRSLRVARDLLYVCAVNIEEVTRGIRSSEQSAASRLFDGMRLAPLGRVEGERAGNWRRTHAARGVTLAQADCLVAAAAVAVNARLATGNPKDFPMPELSVEFWPPGA